MPRTLKPTATPLSQELLTASLLGKYVRARRTQLKLRIDEAAAFCGVAKDTLMKLEHGSATIQLGSVLLICKGLGIKLKILSWEAEEEKDAWV